MEKLYTVSKNKTKSLGRLSYLFLLFFGTLHSVGYIFPFLPCLSLLEATTEKGEGNYQVDVEKGRSGPGKIGTEGKLRVFLQEDEFGTISL